MFDFNSIDLASLDRAITSFDAAASDVMADPDSAIRYFGRLLYHRDVLGDGERDVDPTQTILNDRVRVPVL